MGEWQIRIKPKMTISRPMTRHKTRRNALVVLLETIPPLFHIALVSGLAYYVWHFHPNSPTWVMGSGYCVLQILLNWIQFLRYKSVVPTSTKNFPGYVHRFPSLTSSKDARQTCSEYESMRSTWKECEACDMHVPLLSVHCSHCRKCIYALDHHCYFLGQCIGRGNQRFFIVFCLYAALGSAIGVYNLYEVMSRYRDIASREFTYYLFPFTTIWYLTGSAKSFEVLYVGLIDFGSGACAACIFFFVYSMRNVLLGDPRHAESVEKTRRYGPTTDNPTHLVRILYDDEKEMGAWERFRLVFGSCGFMHFICAFNPLSRKAPVVEQGYRRIVTYNNDYILNGMVHTSEERLNP